MKNEKRNILIPQPFSLLVFLIFLSSFFICSCGNPLILQLLDPKTVYFETNGGSGVLSQIVYRNYPVMRPSDPVRDGYTFDAWYIDNDTFMEQWDFNIIPAAGFTLYANWNIIHVHEWGDWIVTADATETTDGMETRTCLVCNEKETRFSGEYATGTSGLDFALIEPTHPNAGYLVSRGTATGNIVIPAYHRPNPDSDYWPVTIIGKSSNDTSANNAFGGTSPANTNTTVTGITFAAGSKLTTISSFAFLYCANLTTVTIPASVTTIGPSAFSDCANLTTVTIPANSNLTLIDDNVFLGCTSLTGITIPARVTSIGLQAFYVCTSLKSITLPTGLTAIGQNAFWGCTVLTDINIPAGVTSIGINAFNDCTNLKNITIDNDKVTTTIESNWGNIFPAYYLSVTFRKDVGEWAFGGCYNLESVTIAAGVTAIGNNAFESCSYLTSVTIASGVKTIGHEAFLICIGLNSITIPASVTAIGNYAFDGCASLTSVTFAGTITGSSFGNNAFGYGDLSAKHSSGGPGTYTRTSGSGTSNDPYVWTKQ